MSVEAASIPTNDVVEHVTRFSTPPDPLRILLVTAQYLPHVGGTEIHTYEVARRLVAAGNEVTVLTTALEANLPAVENMAGVRVHRVRAWPSRGDYFFAPGIHSFITQGTWDIIHCQGYHTLVAPITMLAAWQAKIPYIVTFHSGGHSSWLRNTLRPLQRMLLRPLLIRAAGLVAVSKWEAGFFREKLRIAPERFIVIPNGAYLPIGTAPSPAERDSTLIVSVGRLERYKGHHRVIASIPLLIDKYPLIHLRIAGSGPYEGNLRQLAYDLKVSDRVEIRPISAKDREGMASVMLGAALVILLSDYEAQGISIMEALALGRPVLVADSTALRELATSGLARATPLGGTVEEVAAAILDQLQQPLIPNSTKLPTWDACATDLLNLYHLTVNSRSMCAS